MNNGTKCGNQYAKIRISLKAAFRTCILSHRFDRNPLRDSLHVRSMIGYIYPQTGIKIKFIRY